MKILFPHTLNLLIFPKNHNFFYFSSHPLQTKRRISTNDCGGCKFSKIWSSLLTLPRYLVRGLALTLTTLGVWRHLYQPTVIGVCKYDIDTLLPLMHAFDNVNI